MKNYEILSGPRRLIPDDFARTEIPKFKFAFFVQFKFRQNAPDHEGTNAWSTNRFAIRQAGRPTPVIEYQPANYYGYRTQVATKITFNTFNISFYDDGNNRAHSLFYNYLQAISPITRYDNASMLDGKRTIGPIDNRHGVLDHIIVYHNHQGVATEYKYLNPKITNVMLDELDMTTSEVATVNMTFNYDSVYITQPTIPKH